MNTPLVSIIIPVFNASEFINQCILSILTQDYNEIEAIFVDDGSSDNSYAIIQNYARKDNRIKLFKQDNKGPSAARNLALENSKGNYIALVDADDFISRNYISSLVSRIKETNADAVVSDMYLYISETETYQHKINNIDIQKDIITGKEALVKSIWWEIHSWILWKKDLYTNVKYDTSNTFGDENTARILMSKCRTISFSDTAKYYYRFNTNSITQKISVKRFHLSKAYIDLKQILKDNNVYHKSMHLIERKLLFTLKDLETFYIMHSKELSHTEQRYAQNAIKDLYKNLDIKIASQEYKKRGFLRFCFFKFKMSSFTIFKTISKLIYLLYRN